MPVIALDLGGTKLALAICSEQGNLRCRRVVPLDHRRGIQVVTLIRDELRALLSVGRERKLKVRAIGISVPGISDPAGGQVWAPNIPGWSRGGGRPLRQELLAGLPDAGIPISIEDDRACSIFGEAWRGAARGCANAIFLAVGTGIGAGILVDGKILRGAGGSAGAIGWLALDRPFQVRYQACGCFESHASGEGLLQMTRARGARHRDTRELFAAWQAGEPRARKVMAEAVEFWGMGAANLVSLFNPEKIIFGGGVFGPARPLLPRILAEASKWAQPIAIRKVKLTVSKLGGDAALYGAAGLALRFLRKTP